MNARTIKTEKVWTTEFFFLFVLSLSYLYCLPLLRTGVVLGVTASEVRLYDLVFVIMLLFLLFPMMSQIFKTWSSMSMAHKFLLYWVLLGIVGLVFTLINSENRFLIAVIRYFRFFSFSIVFVLGFMFIKNRKTSID